MATSPSIRLPLLSLALLGGALSACSDADSGAVGEVPCGAGERACGGVCVDTSAAADHCGGCGQSCGAGERCVAGGCALDCGALATCDGACVDLATTAERCGACDNACDSAERCIDGDCRPLGELQWARAYGDEALQDGWDAAVDDAGAVYVTGTFLGAIDFGGGALTATPAGQMRGDAFLAKLGQDGAHLWSKRFGDAEDQTGFAVDADGTGVVVAGWFSGELDFGAGPVTAVGQDLFVARFDASGALLWSWARGNGVAQQARAVALTADGGAVVAARVGGELDLGAGPTSGGGADVALVAIDAAGETRWARRFVSSENAAPHGLDVDGQGRVVVTGGYHGELTVADDSLASPGGWDDDNIFLVALDATDGAVRWSRRFGDEAPLQVGRDVALGPDGQVTLVGAVAGSVDFGGGTLTSVEPDEYDGFVARFDANGQHLWSELFGGVGAQVPYAVAADPGGDVVVVGDGHGVMAWPGGALESNGPFIVKLDPAGGFVWAHGRPGAAGTLYGCGVAGDGGVAAVGTFSGTLAVGDEVLECAGGADLVVLRYGP